jgi:hypothetical protein
MEEKSNKIRRKQQYFVFEKNKRNWNKVEQSGTKWREIETHLFYCSNKY